MNKQIKRLMHDQRGTSAVEYGFLLGMIVIGLISAVSGVGSETDGLWATVESKSAEAINK